MYHQYRFFYLNKENLKLERVGDIGNVLYRVIEKDGRDLKPL